MSDKSEPIIEDVTDPEISDPELEVSGDADLNGSQNGSGDNRSGSDETENSSTSRPLVGRLLASGTRGVQRAAGVTGIDKTLETAAEEAIVRAVESEATERAIARIINGPTIEAAVHEALQSDAVKQSAIDALDSEMVDQVWARVLASDETELLIKRIAEAPEVRAAIASQGVGLIDDLGRQVRQVTRVLDTVSENFLRTILLRRRVSMATDRVGAVTRILALALDAFIINISLLAISAGISLILNIFNYTSSDTPAAAFAVGASIWFVVSSLYLFTFWALSGQTPGMRFLDIRIETQDGDHHLGARHAIRRLLGFWLATIPFMLGFIGVVLSNERRGFHDRLGGTSVFYIDPSKPGAPHDVVGPESS